MDDNGLYEEESEDGSEDRGTGSTNSKSGKGIRGGSPRSEEEDFPEEEEPMTDPSFPAHLSIVIEKVKHYFVHFSYYLLLTLGRSAAHKFWMKTTAQRGRLKDFRACTRWNGYPSKCDLSLYSPTAQV